MSIRSRVANMIMGKEKKRIDDAINKAFIIMREAYEVGPFHLPPEQLVAQLKETDPWTLQDIILQMQYDIVAGVGATGYTDEWRQRAVDESLRMFHLDVITEFGYELWTNFGFGNSVKIIPNDEAAQEVWDEFWVADRNAEVLGDDKIHELSNTVISQGELYLVIFCSTQDGKCTISVLGDTDNPGTKQITEFITKDGDKNSILYYKREWIDDNGQAQTLYYADWQAFFSGEYEKAKLPEGAERAEKQKAETAVVMLRIAHNCKGGKRGWPLMLAGAPWTRSHKKFREDRASVAAALAMYVHKLKAKGGQRAVDSLRNRIGSSLQTSTGSSLLAYDTNPPAAAGSTWIENEAATLERLPMGSGASDAKEDGDALLRMAGLGVRIYPQWLGVGDTNALATAKSMETPMQRQFARYQTFWAAQWRKLVKIVLGMQEKYISKTFQDKGAEVATDKLIQTDLNGIVTAIAPLIAQTIAAIEKGQAESTPVADILGMVWALVLDALDIDDVSPVAPEAFGAEPETESTTGKAASVTEMVESHDPILIHNVCPLCEYEQAILYPGHKGVLVCAGCGKAYDPEVEGVQDEPSPA